MLSGVHVEAVVSLAQATGKQVIASGGVRELADVERLLQVSDQGVAGVIIGKAIYTKNLPLAAAIEMAKEVKRA
jgi:phosphoribosylformimino-5-aminoimidazole carboxamide ribotide isomerase